MEAHTKQIMAARTALILDQPFFGVLALRLRIVADPSCKTAWVDGRSLGYNPTYVESLTHGQRVGLVAHEVMHVAAGHPWRRDNRDAKKWNVAADHAINPILVSAGFALPDGALLDPANEGKSAEWIYARLPQPQEPEQDEEQEPEQGEDEPSDDGEQGAGDDSSDDGDEGDESEDDGDEQPGEVRDAPSDSAEDGTTEADWSAAVQSAANQAAAQGKLPGELERFTSAAAKTKVDWRSALRRFVQETAAADYTWRQPSPRYVARGLYMPSLRSEEMGPMVIAIDTSGSIDDVLLAQFSSEVRSIVDESNPSRVTVIYCDAKVQRTDTFEREDLTDFESLDAAGGGGTKFGPVFDAVEEMDEQPACIVYLTDLEPWGDNGWPANTPDVPTLWASIREHEVPFGEVLLIND